MTCPAGGDMVDKTWNMHLMETHAVIKKRETGPHVLTWRGL